MKIKRCNDQFKSMKKHRSKRNHRSKNLFQRHSKIFFSFFFFRSEKQFESIRLFLSQYGFCSLDAMYHMFNSKQWVNKRIAKSKRNVEFLFSERFEIFRSFTSVDKVIRLEHGFIRRRFEKSR